MWPFQCKPYFNNFYVQSSCYFSTLNCADKIILLRELPKTQPGQEKADIRYNQSFHMHISKVNIPTSTPLFYTQINRYVTIHRKSKILFFSLTFLKMSSWLGVLPIAVNLLLIHQNFYYHLHETKKTYSLFFFFLRKQEI